MFSCAAAQACKLKGEAGRELSHRVKQKKKKKNGEVICRRKGDIGADAILTKSIGLFHMDKDFLTKK